MLMQSPLIVIRFEEKNCFNSCFLGNGLIDFEEFVRLMENRMERHQSEDAELRSFFSAFDKVNQ